MPTESTLLMEATALALTPTLTGESVLGGGNGMI